MQFPVTIWFHSLGWTSKLSVSDATGATIGYSPLAFGRERCLRIYADETMDREIYAVRLIGSSIGTGFALLDDQGSEIGRFAPPQPKGWSDDGTYVVSVGGEERFEILERSPRLHLVDYFIDPLPVVNVVTGLLIAPVHEVRRRGGGAEVATLTKHRTMLDASYRLDVMGALDGPIKDGPTLDGRERECIMLASVMVAIRVRRFAPSWW